MASMVSGLPSHPGAWPLVTFVLLAGLAISASAMVGAGPVSHWFIDTDDFSRAERVLQLLEGGAWWDPVLHKVGASGLEMHWTRPSDVVVLMIAAPLHWFGMTSRAAIEWASAVSPICLLLALCFAWDWMVRPLARNQDELAVLTLAPISLWTLIGWFAPMRIDHHAIIVVMAVLLLGFSVRAVRGELGWRTAMLSGALGAAAIWVSVEELLFVGCSFAAFGLGWALFGGSKRLTAGVASAGGAAAACAVFLYAERGSGVFGRHAFEIDRLSLFHVSLLGAVAAGWLVMLGLERLSGRRSEGSGVKVIAGRTIIGLCGAVLAGAVMYLLQPQVFDGNVATAVDMSYVALRGGFILEGLEVISPAVVATSGWGAVVRALYSDLLVATLGLAMLGWLLFRAARGRGNIGWIAFVIWFGLFVAWQGWPTNANVVWLNLMGAAPVGYAACFLAGRLGSQRLRRIWGALVISGVGVAQISLSQPGDAAIAGDRAGILNAADIERVSACSTRDIVKLLDAAGIGSGDVVMTYPDFGPAIIWGTEAKVLSIPNHRIQPGFRQSVDTFKAGSDLAARELIDRTGTDAVVLCDSYAAGPFFGLGMDDGDTFGRRLLERRAASWLTEVKISNPTAADVRIYLVERPR